jgi:hypothetical protein
MVAQALNIGYPECNLGASVTGSASRESPVGPNASVISVRSRIGISLGQPLVQSLPATVRSGLVRNLPGTVDPDQLVKVDPAATGFLRVKGELNGSCISNLSDRDEATHYIPTRWRSPSFKVLGYRMLVKTAVGVDVENPGISVERFAELADIIIVESVNVEPYDANYGVVVVCSRRHGNFPS